MKTLTWQKPGQQNVAQELIKIIINYVAELRKKKKLPHKEDIFKQFLKLVETHHYKERDISFYAEKLCLTPKYLSSIIRDVSGELAGNWIDNYVIIEAKALLISSNLTIQEICYKLNFSTPSSFTRFFKRITGMSPRKFRTLKVFPNLIE